MLGKLMKYEIKATARTFFPLYGAILVMSFVVRMMFIVPRAGTLLTLIPPLVLFGLFVALAVLSILMIVQRFNKNLLSDEGYLMFTLPVSVHSLIFSKLLTSMMWVAISCLISIPAFFIIMMDAQVAQGFGDLFRELPRIFGLVSGDYWLFLILFILACFAQLVGFIMTVYASLSVGQLPMFQKYRGIMAFVAFFIINTVNSVAAFGCSVVAMVTGNFAQVPQTMMQMNLTMGATILYNILFAGLLYWGTSYLLTKHLNLE